jgi:hypothetical protein
MRAIPYFLENLRRLVSEQERLQNKLEWLDSE